MDKNENPSHKTQKQQNLEQHEVQQVLTFIKRYGKLMAAAAVAAIAVVLVTRGIAAKNAAKIAEAEHMLSIAQTPTQLEEVVEKYASTPTAPTALLTLAKTLFNQGEITQARAQYDRFMKDYKNSDLRPVTIFGLASCTEADGNYAEAAKEFEAFLKAFPGHYLEAAATLAQARCYEAGGDMTSARITLEDFMAHNPSSAWSDPAEAALQKLTK